MAPEEKLALKAPDLSAQVFRSPPQPKSPANQEERTEEMTEKGAEKVADESSKIIEETTEEATEEADQHSGNGRMVKRVIGKPSEDKKRKL